MDRDRIKRLADGLREALLNAEEAAGGLQKSIADARVALGQIEGALGGGDERDRDPGSRQRKAIQAIYDAGGRFGGDAWADKAAIRVAAGSSVLAQAAMSLPEKYAERREDLRRLTETGERWRTA